MLKKSGIVRAAVLFVLLFGLASCVTLYRNHGYIPGQELLDEIVLRTDTKETLTEKIGPPAVTGVQGDSGWYYIESRFRHYAYRAPQEIERQVLAISFDSGGRVSNIERFGLEDGRVIALSRRITPVSGRNKTFLRQLLGNIGNTPIGNIVGN